MNTYMLNNHTSLRAESSARSHGIIRGVPRASSLSEFNRGIDSSSSMAEIHVTKLAAAKRQLCAAVRIYFAGEDELAVHIVASAAYRLISDLKSQRGRDEVGDYYLNNVFYAVRSYRRGKLPSYMTDNPELMESIHRWAKEFPITATSEYEDIVALVSPDVAQKFWRKRSKIANFLKHADRDSCAHISMEEVDNLTLLMQAHSSYLDLDRGGLGHEGVIFWIYSCVAFGIIEDLLTKLHEIAKHLEFLSHDDQLKFCTEFLNESKGGKKET